MTKAYIAPKRQPSRMTKLKHLAKTHGRSVDRKRAK